MSHEDIVIFSFVSNLFLKEILSDTTCSAPTKLRYTYGTRASVLKSTSGARKYMCCIEVVYGHPPVVDV